MLPGRRGWGCDAAGAASGWGAQWSHPWGRGLTRPDSVLGPRLKGQGQGDEGARGDPDTVLEPKPVAGTRPGWWSLRLERAQVPSSTGELLSRSLAGTRHARPGHRGGVYLVPLFQRPASAMASISVGLGPGAWRGLSPAADQLWDVREKGGLLVTSSKLLFP